MRKLFGSLFLFAIILFFCDSRICAQVITASIQGSIQDSTGAAINGASIAVQNNDTGLVRAERTQADGTYQIDFLPIGTYTVTISSAGFSQLKQLNVVLTAAQQLDM